MRHLLTNLIGELVAPSRCAACDERVLPSSLFCRGCAASVERFTGRIRRHGYECMAAFEYGGAVATAIGRLKYEDRSDLAPRLGLAMLPAANELDRTIDLVVPVPLHTRRLAERGYNQSALLARPVARALGVPIGTTALRRVRDTPKQAALSREERAFNVVAAFRACPSLRGSRVLLIDDVRTSGATLEACAVAVHAAGAREILALVLARAR